MIGIVYVIYSDNRIIYRFSDKYKPIMDLLRKDIWVGIVAVYRCSNLQDLALYAYSLVGKVYTCEICNFSSGKIGNFRSHISSHTHRERVAQIFSTYEFICKYCDRYYPDSNVCLDHMSICTGTNTTTNRKTDTATDRKIDIATNTTTNLTAN